MSFGNQAVRLVGTSSRHRTDNEQMWPDAHNCGAEGDLHKPEELRHRQSRGLLSYCGASIADRQHPVITIPHASYATDIGRVELS